MGVSSVSWTFSDRRSNIRGRRHSTGSARHAFSTHAGSEVVASKSGRCGARGLIFHINKKYAETFPETSGCLLILYPRPLSPRIPVRESVRPRGGCV